MTTSMGNGCSPGCSGDVFDGVLFLIVCCPFSYEMFWMRSGTEIWTSHITTQTNKKLADFHFKLNHEILPNQENIHKWRLSNSNKCRIGCNAVETYNHMFISCSHLKYSHEKLEKIFVR